MNEFFVKTRMKVMTKRTVIITLLYGLFSAISTYLFLHSMEGFKSELQQSKIAVNQMSQQVNMVEGSYKEQVHYWIQKNSYLQNQIQKTDFALSQSRQKEMTLRGQVSRLIAISKTLKDTAAIIINCDSIKQDASQLIYQAGINDSLCGQEIFQLKVLVQDKDSALASCDKHFSMLKQVTDSSLAVQSRLREDLILADKRIRRSNVKSKFLTAGIMFLSGVTTILLLQK